MARAPAPAVSRKQRATARAFHDANGCGRPAGAFEVDGAYWLRWSWNSNCLWLAGAERDDAPDGVVRRNADGHSIARNDFDTEAAHSTAELGQHFVAGVALNPIEATAVNSHYRTLHVYEIVLAQTASNPFVFLDKHCATL